MTLFNKLTQEKCPICKEILTTNKSEILVSHVIKSCPKDHYEKEFIPSLEGYVEQYKVATK
jgi:phage FluMu protein Com